MRRVVIEAALNGPLEPGIPDTVAAIVAEGVACAKAGLRPHRRGDPRFDDPPVYSQIPLGGGLAPEARFAHIEALAQAARPDSVPTPLRIRPCLTEGTRLHPARDSR